MTIYEFNSLRKDSIKEIGTKAKDIAGGHNAPDGCTSGAESFTMFLEI
jgi:hypothetical protein